MRQRVGEKKLKKYRRQTGLPVISALVRGNTDHRVDLQLIDGSTVLWWPARNEIEERPRTEEPTP